jgi:hypothetical protein
MLNRFCCATVGLIYQGRHRRTVKHGHLMPPVREILGQGQRVQLGAPDPFRGRLVDYLLDPHGDPPRT